METPMDLVVEVECLDGATVVKPVGEVDVYTAPLLRDRILEATSGGATRVIADLRQTGFIDSTGMGILITGLKRMKAQRGSFEIVCSDPAILKVLRLMGLTKAMMVHDTCPGVRNEQKVPLANAPLGGTAPHARPAPRWPRTGKGTVSTQVSRSHGREHR